MVHQKYHGSQQESKISISLVKECLLRETVSKKQTTLVLEIQSIEKEEIGLLVLLLTTESVKVLFETLITQKTKSLHGTIAILN